MAFNMTNAVVGVINTTLVGLVPGQDDGSTNPNDGFVSVTIIAIILGTVAVAAFAHRCGLFSCCKTESDEARHLTQTSHPINT